jgi:beta-mannosidase
VLLSIEDDLAEARMTVHVSNDLTEPWEGTVRWSLETLAGETLDTGEVPVEAPPLASSAVETLSFADRLTDDEIRNVVLVCDLWREDRRIARRLAPFVPDKHLALVDPGLAVEMEIVQAGELSFTMTATSLARFVELGLEGVDVVFSDNYVDVPAGRSVTVTCPLPEGWTLSEARDRLRVRSLYSSFA